MHRNRFWLGFLALIALVTLYYSGLALQSVANYYSFTESSVVKRVDWTAVEKGEDRYVIEGEFIFLGEEYKTTLHHPVFANRWSAEEYVEKQQGKGPWRVWYPAKNPEEVTLQKIFPTKKCVSAAVLAAILLYFIGLGIYVGRKQGGEKSG